MTNSILKASVATALGIGFGFATTAQADIVSYDFDAILTKLNWDGSALAIVKGTDQYQSPLTGTLQYDSASGTGTAVIEPFSFDHPSLSPVTDFTMQAIGDGMGGSGTLVLTNFLVDAYLAPAMPVSMVQDAAGLFSGELTAGGTNSATPASDGTSVWYFDGSTGYLGLGPVPIATTAWNTTNTAECVFEACNGVTVSGALPLIFDNATNTYDISSNIGGAIGGSPVQDGRYRTSSINLDFTSMTVVPVPASVWLFGSGLLALFGAAKRKVRI